MPVVLGADSIIVDGKTIETMKYFGGYNDPLATGEPTTDFKFATLTHSGGAENQTSYTINFPNNTVCDILIVAGGGGGGTNAGAGGGAGGLILLESTTVIAGSYDIKVGNGGAGGTTSNAGTLASNGNNSSFGSYTAIAGGAGVNSGGANGNSGGSGGGAGNDGSGNKSGGAGTTGQGFKGGDGTVPGGSDRTGGGGGGAGGPGQNSVSSTRAGNGGVGRNMSLIFGTSVGQAGWFAGGGGGGVHSGTGGTGGQGGGGSENVAGVNGTGGGGGGGRSPNNGLKGGSGIVIIRYKIPIITIDNDYKYLSFFNDGTNQTSYTVNFPTNRVCDVLVVGGGGSGGSDQGGGGGAGGLVYLTNISLLGNYNITVGNGGLGALLGANNGYDSIFGIYTAKGGGKGGHYTGNAIARIGANGGNGGGGGGITTGAYASGGTSTQDVYLDANSIKRGWGNIGGSAANDNGNYYACGGGGGADFPGGNATITVPGNGGNGKAINITGQNLYYAGGGGGSLRISSGTIGGLGGLGGGGNGGYDNVNVLNTVNGNTGRNALPNTGGGGGGISWNAPAGGSGGSGIVIIRYPRTKILSDTQWTYNALNANVYHMGNVNIGSVNLNNFTNALEVIGNTHSTTYSAGKKTFKIEHPLKIKKWLYHGCIEGPRFDNIYRGKKRIVEGKAEVDIDKECNTTGGMTPGTFSALNINYQLYLQNNETYDVVKGIINGSTISIECENITDEIEIDWLVVGERHDEHVINTPLTDSDGNLVCEHYMPGYENIANAIDTGDENIPVTNVDITDEGITDVNN
jgi:hypothetical protein